MKKNSKSGPIRFEISYTNRAASDPVTRSGGLPNLWPGYKGWPSCPYCKEPMSFILQVTNPQVPLPGIGALHLFGCLGSDCELYRPESKSKKIFLIKTALLKDTIFPSENVKPLKNLKISFKKTKEPSQEALRSTDEKVRLKAFRVAFRDKFYGIPVAGNEMAEGTCSVCLKKMIFLGQFMKFDLRGMEDWFVWFLQICPKGHGANFQGVRG